MKIYLATGNKDKKREVQEMFPEHTIVIPKDENIDFDPIEDGKTFYENSLIKAKALYEILIEEHQDSTRSQEAVTYLEYVNKAMEDAAQNPAE